MIKKQTSVEQIEIKANGVIQIRFALDLTEDGNRISRQWHRVSIEPGAALATIRAANETHFANPNGGVPGAPWPAIPDAEWNEVLEYVKIAHTPERIAAFHATE